MTFRKLEKPVKGRSSASHVRIVNHSGSQPTIVLPLETLASVGLRIGLSADVYVDEEAKEIAVVVGKSTVIRRLGGGARLSFSALRPLVKKCASTPVSHRLSSVDGKAAIIIALPLPPPPVEGK